MSSALATLGSAMNDLDQARERMEAACAEADREQAGDGGEDGDPDHTELVDGQPGTVPNPEFDQLVASGLTVLQAKERYRQLLQELGPTGATAITDRLRLEGHGTSRQTVQEWLRWDGNNGHAQRVDEGWIWTGSTT